MKRRKTGGKNGPKEKKRDFVWVFSRIAVPLQVKAGHGHCRAER